MNEPPELESSLPLASTPLDPDVVPHCKQPLPSPIRVWLLCAVGLLAFAGVFVFMLVAGGELRQFAAAGLEACPFAILAVLAYASNPKGVGGKALTLTYWILLIGAAGITSLAITAVSYTHLTLPTSDLV